jgi:hypothetical protein
MHLSLISTTSALLVVGLATAMPTSATAAALSVTALSFPIDPFVGWPAESNNVPPNLWPSIGGLLVQFELIATSSIPLPEGADELQSWIGDEGLLLPD